MEKFVKDKSDLSIQSTYEYFYRLDREGFSVITRRCFITALMTRMKTATTASNGAISTLEKYISWLNGYSGKAVQSTIYKKSGVDLGTAGITNVLDGCSGFTVSIVDYALFIQSQKF